MFYDKIILKRWFIMKWEIKYYINEAAYKSGNSAFKETVNGDRKSAINWAQRKIKSSNFKFYEVVQK